MTEDEIRVRFLEELAYVVGKPVEDISHSIEFDGDFRIDSPQAAAMMGWAQGVLRAAKFDLVDIDRRALTSAVALLACVMAHTPHLVVSES
jgi:hypothetical protein